MQITLRQLQVFEAVARHLSFTRAAEELHLTQPAVSMQIRQIEENTQLPVIEQVGRRIKLTDAGEAMLHCARAVARQLADTEQTLAELKGLELGQLAVAVATTVNYFTTRLLAVFSKRYPGIHISLEVTNRESLLELLDANKTDIVLMGKPPAHADLEAAAFMDNPLVIIAPPDHPLIDVRHIALEDLAAETFLLREQGSGTRIAMERYFAERGVTVTSRMEMNSNEAIKQGVEAGLGLGIVSIHTTGLELSNGLLKVLDVDGFPLIRQWYLVHRRSKRLSTIAQAFKEFVMFESKQLI